MSQRRKLKKEEYKEDLEDIENTDPKKEESDERSEKMKERLDALEQELAKQKEMFIRMAAEYDNYRKRSERERVNIYQDATASAILPILTVADSLRSAAMTENGTAEELKKGMELVNKQLESALEKHGVISFGKVGESFNPDIHNAIAHIDDDSLEENCIVEVFQPGYKIRDKVIRYAVVKVAN